MLLVEEGWHATLTIARGLRDAGVDVTVITANGTAARCANSGVEWRSGPTIDDPRFVSFLDAETFDAVVPLTERAMIRLWDADVPWADRIFPRADPWQQQLVRDKHLLVEHLAANGVPVPRFLHVTSDFDAADAVAALSLPLVVKGATGSGGRRVRIVTSLAELVETLARAEAFDDRWVVQEHITGPTFLVGGLFDRGRPLRLYAGEKLEQHPPRTGGAIRLRSTHDRELVAMGVRAIELLGWTGFASVDLMRCADGGPVVLEINPRLWGSYAGALSAGVELFEPFAQLLAGTSPPAMLDYAPRSTCTIFPRYLNASSYRNVAGVMQALRDFRSDQGRDWRNPRFVLHILHRLYWMRQQAPRL